jgi:hypothetical protein
MSDFTGMIKHVGVLNNTGKNVVVVFMRLPDDPNHALVIDTDALPDQYNEAIRRIVESDEGQKSRNLADILGRRMSPDGSNITLLEKLHHANRLAKVPVQLVTMTPKKGLRWPLEQVISAMDMNRANEPDGFDDLDPETRAAVAADLNRFNVHANNIAGEIGENAREQAMSLLRQAELIEGDAHSMRQKAYKIDPSLAPKIKKVLSVNVDVNESGAKSFAIDTGDLAPAKATALVEGVKQATAKKTAPKKPTASKSTTKKVIG